MSSPVVVSAPGKVILHGEHAVVYQKPALAASLDLRCYLILRTSTSGFITLDVPDLKLEKKWSIPDLATQLQAASNSDDKEATKLHLLKQLSGINTSDETPSTVAVATLVFLYLLVNIYDEKLRELPGLYVTVLSVLPAGAGLGSSAAFSVCLAAAFLTNSGTIESVKLDSTVSVVQQAIGSEVKDVSNITAESLPSIVVRKLKDANVDIASPPHSCCWKKEDLDLINRWGLHAEKLIHGTPSGIDNSISTFGGAIRFQSGYITHLESIPTVKILLINTNVTRSTKKMVSGVRERYEKFPNVISPMMDSIEAVVDSAQKYLELFSDSHQLSGEEEQDTYQRIQELFTINQHLLNGLGVGHPSLDTVCQITKQFGLSAKLTGGGGGGCAIALLPTGFSDSNLIELKSMLSETGFESWTTNIGSKGVTQHQT